MGPAVLFRHWAWISLICRPGVTAAEFGIGIDTSNSAGSPPLCNIFMVPNSCRFNQFPQNYVINLYIPSPPLTIGMSYLSMVTLLSDNTQITKTPFLVRPGCGPLLNRLPPPPQTTFKCPSLSLPPDHQSDRSRRPVPVPPRAHPQPSNAVKVGKPRRGSS